MEFVIDKNYIKVFSRALQTLLKLGDDVFLQASLVSGLTLQTINTPRSAYSIFSFLPAFFNLSKTVSSNVPENSVFKCKVSLKSFYMVFKNSQIIERSVSSCSLKLDMESNLLIVLMNYVYGAKKTFKLFIDDTHDFNYHFSRSDMENHIIISPRILGEFVNHFSMGCEEVSFQCSSESFKIKNFLLPEADSNKTVRTEISINPDEFDVYSVNKDSNITFCLKDFKSLVPFAESCSHPLHLYFHEAGKPIIMTTSCSEYETTLVLSTVVPPSYDELKKVSCRYATQREKSLNDSKSAILQDSTLPHENNGSAVFDPDHCELMEHDEKIINHSKIYSSREPEYNNCEGSFNIPSPPKSATFSEKFFESSRIQTILNSQQRKSLAAKLFSQIEDSTLKLGLSKKGIVIAEDSDQE